MRQIHLLEIFANVILAIIFLVPMVYLHSVLSSLNARKTLRSLANATIDMGGQSCLRSAPSAGGAHEIYANVAPAEVWTHPQVFDSRLMYITGNSKSAMIYHWPRIRHWKESLQPHSTQSQPRLKLTIHYYHRARIVVKLEYPSTGI